MGIFSSKFQALLCFTFLDKFSVLISKLVDFSAQLKNIPRRNSFRVYHYLVSAPFSNKASKIEIESSKQNTTKTQKLESFILDYGKFCWVWQNVVKKQLENMPLSRS